MVQAVPVVAFTHQRRCFHQSLAHTLTAPGSGLSQEVEEDERMEGTALYLAPELAAGGVSSVAGDCWALGCVLYQCLVGRPPVEAHTHSDAPARIVHFAAQVCGLLLSLSSQVIAG